MKKIIVFLSLVVGFSGVAADLAVKPYFVRENGVVSMILRLTNNGASTVKVPTEGYSLNIAEEGGTKVEVTFEMPSFEHESESWAYVPSIQRMGAVELRPKESAAVQVQLLKRLARQLLDPDASYEVSYIVDGAFAKRFGMWSGAAVASKQSSPYKVQGATTVMLKDDGSKSEARPLTFLPSISVAGLGGDDAAISIDPSTLPKVGEKVSIRPAPGGGLKRRVSGEFGGVAGSMVTIGKRRYYILDIHPFDRKKFVDWADYHRN